MGARGGRQGCWAQRGDGKKRLMMMGGSLGALGLRRRGQVLGAPGRGGGGVGTRLGLEASLLLTQITPGSAWVRPEPAGLAGARLLPF